MTLFNPAELPRFTGLIATHGKEIMFIFKTFKKEMQPSQGFGGVCAQHKCTHTCNVRIIASN